MAAVLLVEHWGRGHWYEMSGRYMQCYDTRVLMKNTRIFQRRAFRCEGVCGSNCKEFEKHIQKSGTPSTALCQGRMDIRKGLPASPQ